MCSKERLLDLIENFVAFQDRSGGFVKLLARNHQFLGVNNAIARMEELRHAPPAQERQDPNRPDGPDVAQALARLGQRGRFTGDEDPVFTGTTGGHLDVSALRRRYTAAVKRAQLRALPFHSLRHYFGSIAVNGASLVQVQSWMGHAHIQTTARYLHAKSQASDAQLLADAFAASDLAGASKTAAIADRR